MLFRKKRMKFHCALQFESKTVSRNVSRLRADAFQISYWNHNATEPRFWQRKKRKSKLIPYFLLTTVFQKSETVPPCFNKLKRNLQFTSFYSFGLILKTCTGNNIISPTTGKRNVASSTVSEIRPGHIFTSSHVYDILKRYHYVESKHILKECSMLL